MENHQIISIPEYYKGKSVFVTGGTGFLGKIIVEKLLRSCPEIVNIFLLCRSKKGIKINERFEKVIASPVFDIIREKNPKALNKIILTEGDAALLDLGISKHDQEMLIEKVSIVIHSAATVNFDESMKIAVNTNLRSVRELLSLSKKMKNFESFVHISTAFTNWFDIDVKEENKPADFKPQNMITMMDSLPEKAANELTKSILGKHVNTYTFTKALAENLVLSESKELPVAIVRPSMIGASMNEPIVGWIDSMSALSIYIYMITKGLFRASIVANKFGPCELIPVDLVANMAISAAWKVAMDKKTNLPCSFPQVYHISSGSTNLLKWKEIVDYSLTNGRKYPLENVSWYPKHRIYKSPFLFIADSVLTHVIPAYFADFVSIMMGKTARAAKLQISFLKNYYSASFVSAVPYKFQTSNMNKILNSMNASDKKQFNFDPKTINWKKYMQDYYFGIRKFVMKEKNLNSVNSVRRLTRLKYASYLTTLTTSATGIFLIWKGGSSCIGLLEYFG